MIFREPIPEQRILAVRLLNGGVGLPLAHVWVAAETKISKAGGAFANSSNLPTAIASGVAGTFQVAFTQTELDTPGPLRVQFSPAGGDFAEFIVPVSYLDGAAYYCKAQGGAAATVQLDATASAIDSFYASATHLAVVRIIAGTGAGQSRIASAYVGATKQLTVSDNWVTQPDATSIVFVGAPANVVNLATVFTSIVEGPNQIDGGGEASADPNANVTFVAAIREMLGYTANDATGLDGANPVIKSRVGGRNRIVATCVNGNRKIISRDDT